MNQPNHEHNWIPVSLNDYNHGIGIARVVCMGCLSHSQVRLQHVPPLNPDFHLEHEPGGSEYIPKTAEFAVSGSAKAAVVEYPAEHVSTWSSCDSDEEKEDTAEADGEDWPEIERKLEASTSSYGPKIIWEGPATPMKAGEMYTVTYSYKLGE